MLLSKGGTDGASPIATASHENIGHARVAQVFVSAMADNSFQAEDWTFLSEGFGVYLWRANERGIISTNESRSTSAKPWTTS